MDHELLVIYLGSLLNSLEGLILLDTPTLAKGHDIWYTSLPSFTQAS